MLDLLFLAGACVYLSVAMFMLGAGFATEVEARNPEWRFVLVAAVAWPYFAALHLYHRY